MILFARNIRKGICHQIYRLLNNFQFDCYISSSLQSCYKRHDRSYGKWLFLNCNLYYKTYQKTNAYWDIWQTWRCLYLIRNFQFPSFALKNIKSFTTSHIQLYFTCMHVVISRSLKQHTLSNWFYWNRVKNDIIDVLLLPSRIKNR